MVSIGYPAAYDRVLGSRFRVYRFNAFARLALIPRASLPLARLPDHDALDAGRQARVWPNSAQR